ncbi:MAG: D-alanine--D-alanine ligase [Candidatus Nanopelagicales bacterium]|nr:D-alanine--D-alanine ligase [Candidatus Nanopelagicales bacterium]
MQVVVLAGGLSPERDVSLRSGRRVAKALRAATNFEVIESDVDATLLATLRAQAPDCVIPVLHGAAGEDGALRDVLQSLRIPFVGSGAAACRLAFDKPVAKTLLTDAGVNTPAAVALPHSTFRELGASEVLGAVLNTIGLPLIVKPTKGGSALGAALVHEAAQFPAAMVGSFAYSDVALMESWVQGVEVAVSVLDTPAGPQTLPIAEIVPMSEIYDYSARYTAGTTEFFVPARLTPDIAQRCADIALTAHRVLGLRDWSRTDLIVDAAGTPWFLEVNVAPGMTETSLFPQSLAAAQLLLGEITAQLVHAAISRG